MPELCVKVLTDEPEPLRGGIPLPPAFEAAIARCLRKDRDHRYATVAAFVADLLPFVPRGGAETHERISRLLGLAPMVSPPIGTPSPVPHGLPSERAGFATTLGSSAGDSTPAPPRPPKRWVLPVIGAGVVGAGVIAFVATRGPADSTPATTPPPPVAEPSAAIDAAPVVVARAPQDAAERALETARELDAGTGDSTHAIDAGKQLTTVVKPKSEELPAATIDTGVRSRMASLLACSDRAGVVSISIVVAPDGGAKLAAVSSSGNAVRDCIAREIAKLHFAATPKGGKTVTRLVFPERAATGAPETKPPETKPPETKPPETKPPETKPPENQDPFKTRN
jgi:hypothetical protein